VHPADAVAVPDQQLRAARVTGTLSFVSGISGVILPHL
jgi:hypothetical protein